MLYTVLALVLATEQALSVGVGDKFPAAGLSKLGCSGKKSVIFFYGADDAPSCSKQLAAMDEALPEFQSMGVGVVGVRNRKQSPAMIRSACAMPVTASGWY